ncbi:MAG: PhoX family protein [Formosimonas sp.]
MSIQQKPINRRSFLKLLGGAPLLPLGTLSASALLFSSTTAQAKSSRGARYVASYFTSMAAPTLDQPEQMANITVGSRLNITMSDGRTHEYTLKHEPFFVTGDMVSDGRGGKILAGGYWDIHNQPILDRSVAGQERQVFSDAPDGTSLVSLPNAKVAGVKGNPVFAAVQFEYTTRNLAGEPIYGTLPSPIAILTLDQNPDTGQLRLVKYHNVDMSAVHGLWITCGASLSPWKTHLSSEEYEPDAFAAPDSKGMKQFKAFSKNLYGDENRANPYHYGHLPEVTIHPDGTGSVKKHYCMGRLSHELIQVMPDMRTALMGDDATNSGLFMFVADRAKDLSAGTLYVAQMGAGFSIDPAASGAKLNWIKLGHASSDEIKHMADTLKPSDIMEVKTSDPMDTSFSKIFISGVANWIKVKPGMEKAAAFLETHRYAYLVGGSMGFTKMEGTTVNIKDKIAYSAIQNMVDSMVLNGKGWNAHSGIALDKPLKAGGILQHKLSGGQKDHKGAPIKSEWVPVLTKALLVGEDIAADELGNLSNPNKVGNPDNIKFSEKMRTLFIGEDSANHVNNFLWAYNVDTQQLSRIMSLPAGAESTGLHAVDEINGWTYIMSNFQHAGDWESPLHDKVKATLDPLIRANFKDRYGAAVGYLTADPTSIKLG